jgi:hypothetical protein
MEIRPHWLTGLLLTLLLVAQPLLWRTSHDPATGLSPSPSAGISAGLTAGPRAGRTGDRARPAAGAAQGPAVTGHGRIPPGGYGLGCMGVALALTCQWLVGLGTLLPAGRRWAGWLAVGGAAMLHARSIQSWWGSSWEAGLATLLALAALQSLLLRIARIELRPLSIAPPRLPRAQLSVGDFFVATTLWAILWRLGSPMLAAPGSGQSGQAGSSTPGAGGLLGMFSSSVSGLIEWPMMLTLALTSLLIGLSVGLIAWDTQISRAACVANPYPREA